MKQMENKGLALITVLWIMVILEAVVGSFIYISRIQSKIAGYHVRELKDFAVAKAGVERAIAYLYTREKQGKREGSVPEIYQVSFSGSLGEGEYAAILVNEESKININFCSREQLEKLFSLTEIKDKEILLDFIFEWRKKHKVFATLSELLLCKCINRQNLEKITEMMTVYGEGKININTAQPQILEIIPGLPKEKTPAIIDYRLGPDKTSGTDDDQTFDEATLKALLGLEIFQRLKNTICYRGENFKVTALGKTEKKSKVIVVFLRYDWQLKTIKIKYWKEE